MKVLSTSNYNNKEVINFLKSNFSIIESAEASFVTSQFLEIDSLKVSFKDGVYNVELIGLKDESLNFITNSVNKFLNRIDAIKYILFNVGIISKRELNK